MYRHLQILEDRGLQLRNDMGMDKNRHPARSAATCRWVVEGSNPGERIERPTLQILEL